MKKIVYLLGFLILTTSVITLTSCSWAERALSKAYYIDVDLDDDGDYGDRGGEYNPSFRGGSYKSCNIRKHKCSRGVDRNSDGWCDNCEDNGYYCSMAKHH